MYWDSFIERRNRLLEIRPLDDCLFNTLFVSRIPPKSYLLRSISRESGLSKAVSIPSASNILGISRYLSAMSKAKLRFSRGLS